jgi:hypothetical protein
MPDMQIENTLGAFQPLTPIPPTAVGVLPGQGPGSRILTVENGGVATILAGDWVELDATGTGAHVFAVKKGVHGGVVARAAGIALDQIAIGTTGRIIVEGPAVGKAGAAGVTVGSQVVASTVATDDGCVVAGTTAGTIIGIAVSAGAAVAGSPVNLWVMRQ